MKEIPNSKGYYVTVEGLVFNSKDQNICTFRSNGYNGVTLHYSNGTKMDHYIHRLIAEAFLENPENKPYVNHKDGNKHNNHMNNLEWCTPSENSQHAYDIKLRGSGAEASYAALIADQVHEVCRFLVEGYRVKDLKEKFEVSQSVISSIKNKTRYIEIASLYEFPPKSRSVSEETVRWICHKIVEGFSNREISKLSDSKIQRGAIAQIRERKAYKDISKEFDFN